jgi:hypothetical protein
MFGLWVVIGVDRLVLPRQNVRCLRIIQKLNLTKFNQIFRNNIYIYNIESTN